MPCNGGKTKVVSNISAFKMFGLTKITFFGNKYCLSFCTLRHFCPLWVILIAHFGVYKAKFVLWNYILGLLVSRMLSGYKKSDPSWQMFDMSVWKNHRLTNYSALFSVYKYLWSPGVGMKSIPDPTLILPPLPAMHL